MLPIMEQLLYRNKGWVLDDITYRHSSGAIPTLINKGAAEKIDTETYEAMNDTIFALGATYTVPTGQTFNITKVMIDAVAIAADGDVVIAIYADSTSVAEINIPQNVGHYEQDYPICREFVAGEVVSFYGKTIGADIDKTLNAMFWGLVTT